MTKAIIFDMDGVIIDSEPIYSDRHYRFLQHHKIPVEMTDLHKTAGASGADTWKILQTIWGSEIEQEEYFSAFSEFFKNEPVNYVDIIDREIYAVLDELKAKNYKIGLASSSGIATIKRVLEQGKLTHYFDVILSGEMFEKSKPNPEIYLKSAEKLGVAPEECIAIEDSTYGIQAAKAAGMYVIAKQDDRFNFEQDLADQKIHRLREIMNII